MKLISMTDFVLSGKKLWQIIEYAQFLKTTLNLGMFVPCVDNEVFNYSKHGNENEYQQAKERVLFEGFRIENCTITNDIICIGEGLTLYHTIEDLLIDFKGDITLTKSAQKQLGL